jgi:hypothetical protein
VKRIIALIDEVGEFIGEHKTEWDIHCVRVPVLMRGGFGCREFFVTGTRDAQGREVFREGWVQ